MQIFLQNLTLLGAAALFRFGLHLSSESPQAVAGNGSRPFPASVASNPFRRILAGTGVATMHILSSIIRIPQSLLEHNQVIP